MDPVTVGLTVANGLSNLFGGAAQRKAEKQQYGAARNDAQRDSATQQAQFAADLGLQRDKDQFARAKDVYGMQREQESDAYRRAQTNATNPMRRDLMSALMARLTGGGNGQGMQGAAQRPGSYTPMPANAPRMPQEGQAPAGVGPSMGNPVMKALTGFQGTFNPSQLSGQAPVTQRPNYDAVTQSAAQPYTRIENPLVKEQGMATAQIDKEARARAEQGIQNTMRDFQTGKKDPRRYAQQYGFDPLDPANRDKWIAAFLAEDPTYGKQQGEVASQATRTVGVGSY